MRSHRLLGPSTPMYSIVIVLQKNLSDKSILFLYKMRKNYFFNPETTYNFMYVEHMMAHSNKKVYLDCHFHIFYKFKFTPLSNLSNTLHV